jgi:hypothetical protein
MAAKSGGKASVLFAIWVKLIPFSENVEPIVEPSDAKRNS